MALIWAQHHTKVKILIFCTNKQIAIMSHFFSN